MIKKMIQGKENEEWEVIDVRDTHLLKLKSLSHQGHRRRL